MPNGSPGNGFSGGGGYTPPPANGGGGRLISVPLAAEPTFQKTKSISYKAGNSDQVYAVGDTTSATGASGAMPKTIELQNTGGVPLLIMVGYKTYSDENTIGDSGDSRYVHYMLMPGEFYYPPIRGVIMNANDDSVTQFDGTAISNIASSSVNSGLLWYDTGANLGAHVNVTTDPITVTTDTDHTNFFRVGDLIQIGKGTTQADLTEANQYREILRVQSVTNATTMVCERALYGTDAGDHDLANWNVGHASGSPIYLPFFNAYHDVDKYSVAQTDDSGGFKAFNFFGLGRSTTAIGGLVPGSAAIKFYNPGYQELGLSGITQSTNSGLTASGSYWLKIAIDGGTAESINFTVDSSNVNFGGTNGVLSKIQDVLDEKYYNTAANIFEQKANVSITGGDIRFTSGQRLSTSAIALTAGADGASAAYNIFAQQNGRFKALANIDAAVAARLPDDVNYDRVTYAQSPNSRIFCYDNGNGGLFGVARGSINYETGAIDMTGGPPNAEFVYSVAHTSAFSGKLAASSTTKGGALTDILANTPSQKWDGVLTVKIW